MQIEVTKKRTGRTLRRRNVSQGKTEEHNQMKSVLRTFATSTVVKGVKGLLAEFVELEASTSVPGPKTGKRM
jgi:hypothetical protein